ncbi:hypothetical protein O181_083634 [Austropuccinia psidii MF-1]|uniref:TIP41-like protein n=1 Tax=Austropuccinia psidii MF-1 TaxID=1389203 RepID=A0A9Q3FRY8_9BASI|nr:hypothetical protein [Austropuccinia psidii MF-1]
MSSSTSVKFLKISSNTKSNSISDDNLSNESNGKIIEISGWVVETRKMPILNSNEIKKFNEKLSIPLPEICFGNNSLTIRHPSSGFEYQWNTLDALLMVQSTDNEQEGYLKVAYADHWSQARKSSEMITKVINPFDWTYTTTYSGTNKSLKTKFETPPDLLTHPGIPLALLARPEPILFFDEVTLFEDELHDNGMTSLQVKVRVMPTCIFALSRFFLRVDGVTFRLLDVRFYIDLSTNEIIREVKAKEMKYDEVKRHLPIEKPHDLTPLTDPHWVSQVFKMLEKDEFKIPSHASSTDAEHRKWNDILGAHLDIARLDCNLTAA